MIGSPDAGRNDRAVPPAFRLRSNFEGIRPARLNAWSFPIVIARCRRLGHGAKQEEPRMEDLEGALTPRARTLASRGEILARNDFHQAFVKCPIPPEELLGNLGLFLNRQTLSRLLALHELYRL